MARVIAINSEKIESIAYHPARNGKSSELYVRFNTGRKTVHYRVPKGLYQEFRDSHNNPPYYNADSFYGRHVAAHFKSKTVQAAVVLTLPLPSGLSSLEDGTEDDLFFGI